MKKTLFFGAMLFLLGAGCAGTQPQVSLEQSVTLPSGTNISIPEDAALLPKNRAWQRVMIKNFNHPYSLEIHPWWHWRATKKALVDDGGAVFASNAALVDTGGRDKAGIKIIWTGYALGENKAIQTFDGIVANASIVSCDILKKEINGFNVCAGKVGDNDTFRRAVAFRNDENYVWAPVIDYAVPFENGLGYFIHMLSTFQRS